MAAGKNITRKKGNKCHLPYDIEAVGKNIKWGKGKRTEILGKKLRFKKYWDGKEYQFVRSS